MKEYLAPVFQLFFYASIILFAAAAFRWRDRLYALKGHLFLVALGFPVLGFFLLSRAVVSSTLSEAATPLILGGGVNFVGMALLAVAIYGFVKAGATGPVGPVGPVREIR